MQSRQIKSRYVWAAALVLFTTVSASLAGEKIIQKEKISFEKCLNVITTSQNKLSIAPKITDVPDQKRVALFLLADGTLTITCDAVEGDITVSTNLN